MVYLRKSLDVLHPVESGAQGDLQDHAVVRHATLLVVVDIVLAPLADNAELLHIVGEVARHQRVQARGEGASSAKALGAAVDVADLGVRAQRNVLVQARQGHVIEEAGGARDAREVARIVELR